ncbi:hypothetical protein BWQ96_03622 [Gracilariopsis chorda]|uniref:Ubiquinol-cytochrome c chaperone domain-containing protein n=1 Tax=Gracilariopsis chorda TaxID=448386 RepID=A0A2V3IX47_9FLOR|nr:hypothetical protein BWQ96_03622 [Gracilariopsis chorda]|eukprot:PXF46633.1 hypothetical protein BWQ96_03622 [Gracilariopsis chorda]
MLRLSLARSAANGARNMPYRNVLQRSITSKEVGLRTLCSKSYQHEPKRTPPPATKKRTLLERIFTPSISRQNPILKALGYYSAESRAIGAGTSLYRQALERGDAIVKAECGNNHGFSAWFEMLSVHIYLTLRRLRAEKGSMYENDVKTAMQCLFDVFWTDVRSRMMNDHKMTLITSGKWVKECEQIFFGLAMSFDEGWEDEEIMRDGIRRNITCLEEDRVKIENLRKYMMREHARLERASIEQLWDGTCWGSDYTAFRSV